MSGNQRSRRSAPSSVEIVEIPPVEFVETPPRGRGRPRASQAAGAAAPLQNPPIAAPAAAAASLQNPPIAAPALMNGNEGALGGQGAAPPLPAEAPPAPSRGRVPPPPPPPSPATHSVPALVVPSTTSTQANAANFSVGDFYPWSFPIAYHPYYQYPQHGSYVPPQVHMPPAPSAQQQLMQLQAIGQPAALPPLRSASLAASAAAVQAPEPAPVAVPPPRPAAVGAAALPAPVAPLQAPQPAPAVIPPPRPVAVLETGPPAAAGPVPAAAGPMPAPPAVVPNVGAGEDGERPQDTISRLRRLLTESQRANAGLGRYVRNLEEQLEYLQRTRQNQNNFQFKNNNKHNRRFRGF